MLPLSAYIRTQNEQTRISEIIQAAQQVAQEVIVVDSGSTDQTFELAKKAGAKVIHQTWLGNGKQKRFAEEHCQNDWVLDIDADELVSPELARQIRILLETPPPCPVYAIRMETVTPFGKIWRYAGVVYRNKLYNKSLIRQPDHPRYDQFSLPRTMRLGKLHAPLYHFGFRHLEDHVRKHNSGSSASVRHTRLKPAWILSLRIFFAFPFYLLHKLFYRRLILGGRYGIIIATSSAFARWLKDAKMLEAHLKNKYPPLSCKDFWEKLDKGRRD